MTTDVKWNSWDKTRRAKSCWLRHIETWWSIFQQKLDIDIAYRSSLGVKSCFVPTSCSKRTSARLHGWPTSRSAFGPSPVRWSRRRSNEGKKAKRMEPQQRKAMRQRKAPTVHASRRQPASMSLWGLQRQHLEACLRLRSQPLQYVHQPPFSFGTFPCCAGVKNCAWLFFLLFSSCCFLLKLDGNTVRVIVILVCWHAYWLDAILIHNRMWCDHCKVQKCCALQVNQPPRKLHAGYWPVQKLWGLNQIIQLKVT